MAVLLLVTAGCMGLATGDPDPEKIASEIETRHENIDSVEGVQVSETELDGKTVRTTTEVVEIPGEVSKRVVTDSDSERMGTEGFATITKDGVTRTYNPDKNTVTKFEHDSEIGGGLAGSAVDGDQIERILNDSNVSYEGTDTVADRDVHVIRIDSEDGQPTSTVTAYVDQEYWYPLRTETTFESSDGETTTTVSYFESVEFNGDVRADDVTLDVPEDATVEEFEGPDTHQFDSAAAVKEAAPFTIGDPDLGETYQFERGSSITMDGHVSYTLTYESTDATIRYTVSNQSDYELDGERIDLNGTEGYLNEYGESTTVLWEQNELRQTIGGDADREIIIDAATAVVDE
ncbi:LolA family protein [Halohasta litorea]|uniref:Outer membrane lipoprotein carrier protein LolA n=1 Tax=Halohasta litorea TaxID=869891 RepID=A0ABD6DBG0_9EURY|nr:DUF4367 domain-containing protein [Halohasta litorea]